MSQDTSAADSSTCPADVVAAAREVIRAEEHRCVVSVSQRLDELGHRFGGKFLVTSEMYQLVDLIETLWDEPHIEQVPYGRIEFAWDEVGPTAVHEVDHSFASLREKLIEQGKEEQ